MKRTYLFGAMAFGLLFTGCSDDMLDGPGNKVAEVDKTLYVSMNIRGDMGGTRTAGQDGNPLDGTTDFDPGSGESEISKAYFVFYDMNGDPVGEIVQVDLTNPVTTATNTVEKYYQSVVPVSVYKGELLPIQVVCYINPISPSSLQNALSTIQTNTREILYSGDATSGRYFAMSNSVYYPNAGADQASAKPQIAVPIAESQLKETKAEAEKALEDGDIVDIYVERYAAKLQFQYDEDNVKDYVTSTSKINDQEEIPVTLSFEPQRWALNAACDESYIVKSFREVGDGATPLPENYAYGALNTIINANISDDANAWGWNNYTYHRSYWAMSPAYFTREYPEVSFDVNPRLNPNNHLDVNQTYYTYDQLVPSTTGVTAKGYADDDSTPHYFHETTVGSVALASKNPAAAVASVILVGQYSLKVGNYEVPNDAEGKLPTFYTYLTGSNGNAQVYFKAAGALGYSAVMNGTTPVGESMLRRFIEQSSVFYKKVTVDDEDAYVPFDITDEATMRNLVSVLKVAAPSAAVRGNIKVAERYRTLQFHGEGTGEEGETLEGADLAADQLTDAQKAFLATIYIPTDKGYQPILTGGTAKVPALTLVEANKILMKQIGFCAKYEEGEAYFNIPVKHLGWYRKGNMQNEANDPDGDGTIDWKQVRVGDFGVVRNHSYQINVSEIKGLGTGIGGKYNPIVPPGDTDDYFVAYRVNILKWAVVPQQNVKL